MSARYVEIVEGTPKRQVRKVPLTGHDTFLRDAMRIINDWRASGMDGNTEVRVHEGTFAHGVAEQVHKGTLDNFHAWDYLGLLK